jgi:hypothetical protein
MSQNKAKSSNSKKSLKKVTLSPVKNLKHKDWIS